jgi:hypothetical protein
MPACIPLIEAAGFDRSRFDVTGFAGLGRLGIDRIFPRTCDDPTVLAVLLLASDHA